MTSNFIPYQHPVFLLIAHGPWKMAFGVHTRAIAMDRVTIFIENKRPADLQENPASAEEILQLISEQKSIEIQLEHEFEHIDVPVVEVGLEIYTPEKTGIEVVLKVTSINSDLQTLIECLTE